MNWAIRKQFAKWRVPTRTRNRRLLSVSCVWTNVRPKMFLELQLTVFYSAFSNFKRLVNGAVRNWEGCAFVSGTIASILGWIRTSGEGDWNTGLLLHLLKFCRQPTKESVSYTKQGTEITPSLRKWLTLFGNTYYIHTYIHTHIHTYIHNFVLISFSNFFFLTILCLWNENCLTWEIFPLLYGRSWRLYTYWHILSTGESLDHEMWSDESNSFRIGFLNLPYFNFEFSWNFTELCEPQFICKKIEMWANTAVVSLPYWIEGNVSIRRVDITDGKVRRYMLNFLFYFLKNREANSSVFWKTYGLVVLVKLNYSL